MSDNKPRGERMSLGDRMALARLIYADANPSAAERIEQRITEVEEQTGISPTPLNEIELPQDGPYG